MSEELEKKNIQNEISTFLKRRDEKGNSLLHYIVKSDNEVFAEQIISAGCDVNVKNNDGDPPLIFAIQQNQLKMVKLLLEAGAAYNNDHFTDNYGPLHVAAHWGCPEIVQLFVEMGVDVNALSERHLTALHYANVCSDEKESDDHCRIINTLIDAGADMNAMNRDGWSPVSYALLNKFYAGLKLMLNRGAEIRTRINICILGESLCDNDSCRLKWLVELGYDINMVDDVGHSCLHKAVFFCNIKTIEFLLNNGAVINVDNDGLDALCFGLIEWCDDYEDLSEFSDDHDQEIEEKNSETFIRHKECLNILIAWGSNVNHVTNDGLTPLYIVLKNYECFHSHFVSILLKNGAKLDFDHPSVQELINTSNESKFPHLLLKHTAIFEAQGRKDGPANFDMSKLNEKSRKDYARCRDELELMKSTKVNDTNVTFFNVLTNKDIGPFTHNEHIKATFEDSDISKRFPIYNDLLRDRFSEEVEFQMLLEKATNSLCCIFNWNRNSMHLLLSNILCYLSKKDLSNLALMQ